MYAVGYLSFNIGYVTLPLLYMVFALALNLFYTFGWISELVFARRIRSKRSEPKSRLYAYLGYLLVSVLFVVGFACFLRIINR